jgi:NAD(P)-dependent dehydrogenase (short-subunit alcohol dehydrogenase family)
VSDETAWQRATDRALATHGRLDVVVDNAGISFVRPVEDTSLEEWRQVMAVNLDGVFLGTKEDRGHRDRFNEHGSATMGSGDQGDHPWQGRQGISSCRLQEVTRGKPRVDRHVLDSEGRTDER